MATSGRERACWRLHRAHTFAAEVSYAADAYVRLLSTYSPTLALLDADREALLGEIAELINCRYGGSVTKRYLFELVLARAT